ncbi:Transient receptor potential cation channel subfamily A member 1, partial [Paramuricea clavata]
MEFVKAACEKEEVRCDSSVSWTGLPAKRVPQPVPDPERPFHYMLVAVTPSCTDSGDARHRICGRIYRTFSNLQSVKKIRARTRAEEQNQRKEKKSEEYDWLKLVLQGKIDKLTVQELDKYINKHNLSKKGKQKDKLSAITADVLRKSLARSTEHALEQLHIDQRSSDSDGESERILLWKSLGQIMRLEMNLK